RVCEYLHIPAQSGSNAVLKRMKRQYTVEQYVELIDKARQIVPGISLAGDFIVGFTGETEEDHAATLALIERVRYKNIFMFKYSPRPGTPAFEMEDDVSREEKTRRFLALEKVQKLHQVNSFQATLGKPLKVLVEGRSSRSEGTFRGHSTCHRLVNFTAPDECLGKIVDVEITECKTNTLFGKMVEPGVERS
ncbi:MAG TPA: radical SAM protein, partial [Pyrinomonadaceae bacterium]|nr:radical SAM protein [Pyrinomonadaceae bacterium]